MKRTMAAFVALVSLPFTLACGTPEPFEEEGALEVKMGSHDVWPGTVNSARIAMSRGADQMRSGQPPPEGITGQ